MNDISVVCKILRNIFPSYFNMSLTKSREIALKLLFIITEEYTLKVRLHVPSP